MAIKRRDLIKGAISIGAISGFPGMALAMDRPSHRYLEKAHQIHSNMLVVNGLDVADSSDEYLALLKKAGVNCWHKSLGGLDWFSDLYNFSDAHDDVVVARSVKEIRQAYRQKKISIVCGWQSADRLASRLLRTGPPVSLLRAYYELGLRIIGLTYNLMNAFGAGSMEGHVPLSRAGRLLVEEIHKLNLLLDIGGHTGEQTSLDAIAMSAGRPVICSHTNIAAIANNKRNISDRLIDAIAKTGGVIGLTALNDYHVRDSERDMNVPHARRVGVTALVEQMEYLKKRVGVEHIGLGPDFVHGRNINYKQRNQSLSINREILSDGEWLYVKGFEDISELPNVTASMLQRGWSVQEIKMVLGDNWLRVYEQAWGM